MKIKVRDTWDRLGQVREVELETLLVPHPFDATEETEVIRECVRANARAMARLLAHLVETRRLKVEKALDIVERHMEVVK